MLCLDEITPEERELIIQLRERVRNELPAPELSKSEEDQDLFLVRWIRARDNNLDKATAMLRNSLNWRKVHDADKVLETERHPFYAMNYKYSFPGLDKFGRPVAILPMNEWDARKIGTDPELLKEYDVFCTRFFEELMDNIKKAHVNRGNGHPPITQIFVISDVKNYPYGQLLNFSAVKKLLQGAGTYEAHYPEILFKVIYINCPSYFGMFLNLLKPIVATKTLGKFHCYPSMEEWKKDMVDMVDPAILPERYGGTADVNTENGKGDDIDTILNKPVAS